MNDRHRRTPVANLGPCTIEQCDCGVLHVTVGMITMRLQPETAGALCSALQRALASTSAPVGSLRLRELAD
jgi:hypothetical protein